MLNQENPKSILIVEDEPRIAKLLQDYFVSSGYGVSVLYEGTEAVEYISENKPDCVILDVMLPGKDGVTICREVRQFSTIPIVMVTARVDEIDRLLGLELGADDYICKPFSPREVVVRVRNLLRRAEAVITLNHDESVDTIEYQNLLLDKERQSVSYNNKAVTLTSVEFRMIFAMARSPGKIFDRDQLIDAAYRDRRVVSDRTIDTHVKNIRKKIHDVSDDELIHSVYGRGYKVE